MNAFRQRAWSARNQRSDRRPFIVGQITRVVVVPAAFRRSDTALSEKIAQYRRPLLLRMPYNLAIVCGIGMLARAVSLRMRVCYRNIQACLKMACFHISQDADTASYR
jgi:hypothetical protein